MAKRVLAPSYDEATARPRKMREPRKPKVPRAPGSLTPQQIFAQRAGQAWTKMLTMEQKQSFGKNFMTFMVRLRACPDYLNLSPAQLTACVSAQTR